MASLTIYLDEETLKAVEMTLWDQSVHTLASGSLCDTACSHRLENSSSFPQFHSPGDWWIDFKKKRN